MFYNIKGIWEILRKLYMLGIVQNFSMQSSFYRWNETIALVFQSIDK